MEIIKNNSFDNFDPTPGLKSSPIPILFISFNNNEYKCSYCNKYYLSSSIYSGHSKYCENCLFWYIKYIPDNNKYLDVTISTKNNNAQCIEHEATRKTTNIREWCEYCSEILHLNQVVTSYLYQYNGCFCNICKKNK